MDVFSESFSINILLVILIKRLVALNILLMVDLLSSSYARSYSSPELSSSVSPSVSASISESFPVSFFAFVSPVQVSSDWLHPDSESLALDLLLTDLDSSSVERSDPPRDSPCVDELGCFNWCRDRLSLRVKAAPQSKHLY